MGKRLLRKMVSDAMRTAGFSSRYYYGGTKRQRNKYCNAQYLRDLLHMLSLRPGTLVNDCDAFNHCVKGHSGYFQRFDKNFHKFVLDQLEFEDGRRSCGCPGGPGPALSQSQVEAYWIRTDEEIEEAKRTGWWTEESQRIQDLLKAGKHICDVDGIKLPEIGK